MKDKQTMGEGRAPTRLNKATPLLGCPGTLTPLSQVL